VAEALAVIELLDERIAPLDRELGPLARADRRVALLSTIPGIGPVLGLTIAAEIGDVARFQSPRKLIGYSGLAPRVKQSGQRARSGELSKAGSRTLRFAAVEAAQGDSRETNPWHRPYSDVKARTGKANPAKSAVARKVLIACWHVLSREKPFKPSRALIFSRPAPSAFWPPDGPHAN
jgi:transposase